MGEPELDRLRRQLRLALNSNERLRKELTEIRPKYQRMLEGHRQRTYDQKQRAELWKHRALNKGESA